jgi:hypothetical protein
MIYLFFALIFIAYLYFAYKDDYKRDKINFKRIVFDLLGMLLLGIFFNFIRRKLAVPVRHNISVYYENKLGMTKDLIDKGLADGTFLQKMSAFSEKVNSSMSIYNILFSILFFLVAVNLREFIKKKVHT